MNQTATALAAANQSFAAANGSTALAAAALSAAFATPAPASALLNATAGNASQAAVGVEAAAPVRDFLDCQVAGGAWVRADRHFDDVFVALQV